MPLNGFSINTSGSPRRLATRDTEAFWRNLVSAGGTDINANDEVSRIAAFLISLYDLYGRDSVVCWPARSGQNAGTGSKIFSLGGLGALTGTLVNGPTWGSGGITFTAASSQLITTPLSAVSDTFTAFAAVNPTRSAPSKYYIGQDNAVRAWGAFHTGATIIQAGVAAGRVGPTGTSNITPPTSGLFCHAASKNGTTFSHRINGTGSPASFGTSNYSNLTAEPFTIGARSAGVASFDGVIAFVAMIYKASSASVQTQLYNAFKSTIGSDLSLP